MVGYEASAPTNDGVDRPAVDSDPAGSVSSEGYGEGLSEGSSGEASTETDTAPPEHRFTTKASECDHKIVTGAWVATVQINGQPRCSLCGTPAVRYRESA
jgi:hypothetical protein